MSTMQLEVELSTKTGGTLGKKKNSSGQPSDSFDAGPRSSSYTDSQTLSKMSSSISWKKGLKVMGAMSGDIIGVKSGERIAGKGPEIIGMESSTEESTASDSDSHSVGLEKGAESFLQELMNNLSLPSELLAISTSSSSPILATASGQDRSIKSESSQWDNESALSHLGSRNRKAKTAQGQPSVWESMLNQRPNKETELNAIKNISAEQRNENFETYVGVDGDDLLYAKNGKQKNSGLRETKKKLKKWSSSTTLAARQSFQTVQGLRVSRHVSRSIEKLRALPFANSDQPMSLREQSIIQRSNQLLKKSVACVSFQNLKERSISNKSLLKQTNAAFVEAKYLPAKLHLKKWIKASHLTGKTGHSSCSFLSKDEKNTKTRGNKETSIIVADRGLSDQDGDFQDTTTRQEVEMATDSQKPKCEVYSTNLDEVETTMELLVFTENTSHVSRSETSLAGITQRLSAPTTLSEDAVDARSVKEPAPANSESYQTVPDEFERIEVEHCSFRPEMSVNNRTGHGQSVNDHKENEVKMPLDETLQTEILPNDVDETSTMILMTEAEEEVECATVGNRFQAEMLHDATPPASVAPSDHSRLEPCDSVDEILGNSKELPSDVALEQNQKSTPSNKNKKCGKKGDSHFVSGVASSMITEKINKGPTKENDWCLDLQNDGRSQLQAVRKRKSFKRRTLSFFKKRTTQLTRKTGAEDDLSSLKVMVSLKSMAKKKKSEVVKEAQQEQGEIGGAAETSAEEDSIRPTETDTSLVPEVRKSRRKTREKREPQSQDVTSVDAGTLPGFNELVSLVGMDMQGVADGIIACAVDCVENPSSEHSLPTEESEDELDREMGCKACGTIKEQNYCGPFHAGRIDKTRSDISLLEVLEAPSSAPSASSASSGGFAMKTSVLCGTEIFGNAPGHDTSSDESGSSKAGSGSIGSCTQTDLDTIGTVIVVPTNQDLLEAPAARRRSRGKKQEGRRRLKEGTRRSKGQVRPTLFEQEVDAEKSAVKEAQNVEQQPVVKKRLLRLLHKSKNARGGAEGDTPSALQIYAPSDDLIESSSRSQDADDDNEGGILGNIMAARVSDLSSQSEHTDTWDSMLSGSIFSKSLLSGSLGRSWSGDSDVFSGISSETG